MPPCAWRRSAASVSHQTGSRSLYLSCARFCAWRGHPPHAPPPSQKRCGRHDACQVQMCAYSVVIDMSIACTQLMLHPVLAAQCRGVAGQLEMWNKPAACRKSCSVHWLPLHTPNRNPSAPAGLSLSLASTLQVLQLYCKTCHGTDDNLLPQLHAFLLTRQSFNTHYQPLIRSFATAKAITLEGQGTLLVTQPTNFCRHAALQPARGPHAFAGRQRANPRRDPLPG